MPRQNFISKEFFVNVSEANSRVALLSLKQCSESIKFVKENSVTQAFRFLYQPKESRKSYQIDISLLPLDLSYTQVSLHLSYPDGKAIHTDVHIKSTLLLFEQLIYAGVKGNISDIIETSNVDTTRTRKFSLPFLHWGDLFFGKKKRVIHL